MNTIIYYFTGTGNNLAIARQLADELKNVDLQPMRQLLTDKMISEDYDWVGFVAPCYYSHVPPFVVECMRNITFHEKQKVFLITACGGNRGLTIQDMRNAVEQSGKLVSLEYMVIVPGNYILSYGAFPAWYQKVAIKRAKRKVHRIAQDISHNREQRPLKKGIFYSDHMEERLQETIAGYADVARQYEISSACIACGECIKICPVGNITMDNGRILFGDHCNQCMACIQWCSQKAIDYQNRAQGRKRYHHPDILRKDLYN